jgi:hypothetical protein
MIIQKRMPFVKEWVRTLGRGLLEIGISAQATEDHCQWRLNCFNHSLNKNSTHVSPRHICEIGQIKK